MPGTLRRSRTYIVVPRDVNPENFLFVPETRKERRVGLGRCLLLPLSLGLGLAALLGLAGYFLHQHSSTASPAAWPDTKAGQAYVVIRHTGRRSTP